MSAVPAEKLTPTLQRYVAAFEERWGAKEAAALRREALDAFLAHGFPTPRDEAWKYTNLRRFETRSFQLPAATPVDADALGLIARGGARIVLVDGRWSPALSSAAVHPPGVTIASLGQWFARDPVAAHTRLAACAPARSSPLERLNLAFCEDGVLIELAPDATPDEPIYVVHYWSSQAQGRMSYPRILLSAGRHSRCTLVEHYLGPADVEYFTNAVTTLELGAGANVQHYRLQQESTRSFHLGHIDTRLKDNARYALHDIALGASLGRTDATAILEGPGAHVDMHGLFAPDGAQHLDAHTRIDHAAAHTTSYEDYRGVAGGRGRGVFNGKIIVRPGAQKIDAQQSSRNLLLSTTAEIDAKPELEIYAHDVKCSHGATTGRLDQTALFYLRSRGVSETEARALLIRAFAESILTSVEHVPLREYLEAQLDARFSIPSESES